MNPTREPQVAIVRQALDRVPLSLIVDDSAPLVNLNYFWMRDRSAHPGQPYHAALGAAAAHTPQQRVSMVEIAG